MSIRAFSPWSLLPILLCGAQASTALTYTVDTTSDLGLSDCLPAVPADCSLRGALLAANATPAADLIAFDLPTGDPGFDPVSASWLIQVGATALPGVEQPVTIDGYSQAGAVENTVSADDTTRGLDSVLKIRLRPATLPTSQVGLEINGSFFAQAGSVFRGLNVAGFATQIALTGSGVHRVEGCYLGTTLAGTQAAVSGNSRGVGIRAQNTGGYVIGGLTPASRNLISGLNNGISAFQGVDGLRVQGNLIGTDRSGSVGIGQLVNALVFTGGLRNARIGGTDPAARNVISASGLQALYLSYSGDPTPFAGTRIEGNAFGTDVSERRPLGNGRNPASPSQVVPTLTVFGANACALQIGGSDAGAANLFAYGGAGGVQVATCSGVMAVHNRYVGNRGPAIDLSPGSNQDGPTANDPGDPDEGGNRQLNFPAFSVPAGADGAAPLDVSFLVGSAAGTAAFPLTVHFMRAGCGNGGATPLASVTLSEAQAQSTQVHTLTSFDGGNVFPLTLLTTDAAGNTSEFAPVVGEGLFANDFEDVPAPIGPSRCE